MNDRTGVSAILVLGMHRSGTSALTGVVRQLGVSLGRDLVDARKGVNDKGFWEHRATLALNERLFKALGSRWYEVQPFPARWWEGGKFKDLKSEAWGVVEREFLDSPLWAIKDPRLCRLLPFWTKLLSENAIGAGCVLIHRNPLEVVDSLRQRDRWNAVHGLLLWLEHVLDAEHYSREHPRVFVSYDELLSDWRGVVRRIECDLNVSWPTEPETVANDVSEFLSRGLKHHSRTDFNTQNQTSVHRWAEEVYGLLESARRNDDEAVKARFSQLRQVFSIASDLFGPFIKGQEGRIKELEEGFDGAMKQLRTQAKANEGLRQTVDLVETRNRELANAKREIHQLRRRNMSAIFPFFRTGSFKRPTRPAKEPNIFDVQVNADKQSNSVSSGTIIETPLYNGVIDLRATNNSHTQLVLLLQEHSAGRPCRILEVGCATGYLGEALKDYGHEVWGIEKSQVAAHQARSKLDRVFAMGIEEFFDLEELEDTKFDYVLFGDVLEHLANPREVLGRCRDLLKAGGAVIASVPNVAHKAVRLMLFQGRWEYADTGILDRTHLRFYTRDSLIDLFSEAEYCIQTVTTVNQSSSETGIAVDSELEVAVDYLISDNETEVFQYVLLAQPRRANTECARDNARFKTSASPRILCLPALPEWTIGNLRLRDPIGKMVQQFGGQLRIRDVNRVEPHDIDWAEVAVFQRESNPYLLRMMDDLQKRGKRIIVDIDDLLTELPPFLSGHVHAKRVRPYIQEALRMADAVTVTTPRLKYEIEQYNTRVYVIPNCSYSLYPPVQHFETDNEPIKLLVASSDTIRLNFIVPSLRRLLDDPSSNFQLIGIGPPGQYFKEQGLEIEVHPIMTHDQFKAFLATLNNGIGLIPLDASRFSQCKSAIKYIDFALAGVPAVCSATPPYSDVIAHDKDGILCDNEESAWYEQVKRLGESASLRRDLAVQARKMALEQYNLTHAGNGWRQILGAVEAGVGQRGSRLLGRARLRMVVTQLTALSNYRAALRVYRTEGFPGLKTRFRRYLKV